MNLGQLASINDVYSAYKAYSFAQLFADTLAKKIKLQTKMNELAGFITKFKGRPPIQSNHQGGVLQIKDYEVLDFFKLHLEEKNQAKESNIVEHNQSPNRILMIGFGLLLILTFVIIRFRKYI